MRHYLMLSSLLLLFLCLALCTTSSAFVVVRPRSVSLNSLRPGHLQLSLSTKSVVESQAQAIPSPLFRKQQNEKLNSLVAAFTKFGMVAFIASMCLALPLTLLPQRALYKLRLIDRTRMERWALFTGQFCARWLFRAMPFCRLDLITDKSCHKDPQPAVWVCNHTSMIDVFLLLVADRRLRGPHRRPIKIVYWQQLEKNPISKLLFTQAGFIPVQMAANKAGEDNEYDRASFKRLLKDSKRAFAEGFDLGVLPEGQLNPTPENGLLPVFSGAYTLAKMAKRPVYMMALHGPHKLWHPNEEVGMKVTGRHVKVRCYPTGRFYESADEFKEAFETVVGHFCKTGHDDPKWEDWLSGKAWQEEKKKREKAKEENTVPE